MKPICLDFETSVSKTKIHKPGWKNLDTDIYTIIYGSRPDEIKIEHKEQGYNRVIPDIFDGHDVVVGHNLHFDLGYVWGNPSWQTYIKHGGTIWDTSECEYLLSGQRHKYPSLAELQLIYLGKKEKKDRISKLFNAGFGADEILKRKYTHRRVYALYTQYCKDDGATTLQIFKAQYQRAKAAGCLPLIKARMKALLGIIMMECTGMALDVEKCENTLRDYKLRALQHLSKATSMVEHLWDDRLGQLNINSPKQKSAILFGGTFVVKECVEDGLYKNGNVKYKSVDKEIYIAGFGLDKSYTRESKHVGVYSTDADVIFKIATKCDNQLAKEYCAEQIKAMTTHKMCSTYLEPFLRYQIDGTIYPNYNTVATQTGRLSSSAPNMQNVPASGPRLKDIQGQIVAPVGFKCVSIDFSQLEPFVTAMLSQDHNLTSDLLSGVCLHCRALSWVPRLSDGKTYDEIYQLAKVQEVPEWVLKRKKAKGINFKRAYGGGAKSLAEKEELAVEDVQAVFDAQDAEYPQVKQFNDKLFAKLAENQQLSRAIHYSKEDRKGRAFRAGIELLPIFDNMGNKMYWDDEYRHFGTYTTVFGHTFCFEEYGRLDRNGQLRRGYSTTETKNYHVQGTAGDIVCLALAKLVDYKLKHDEEVQIVRQIHDELSFYIKDNNNKHTHIKKIKEIMIGVKSLGKKYFNIDLPFDFGVGISVGPNFGSLASYEESK